MKYKNETDQPVVLRFWQEDKPNFIWSLHLRPFGWADIKTPLRHDYITIERERP